MFVNELEGGKSKIRAASRSYMWGGVGGSRWLVQCRAGASVVLVQCRAGAGVHALKRAAQARRGPIKLHRAAGQFGTENWRWQAKGEE
jgi:hypothetical protein